MFRKHKAYKTCATFYAVMTFESTKDYSKMKNVLFSLPFSPEPISFEL